MCLTSADVTFHLSSRSQIHSFGRFSLPSYYAPAGKEGGNKR